MSDEFDFDAALAAAVASQGDNPVEDAPAAEVADNVQDAVQDEQVLEDETPAEDIVEEDEVVEDEVEKPTFDDPDVSAYVERFGGDLNAALRSAVEAQSLIGRQGNELGELRKMVQGIQERMDQPQQTQQMIPPGALEDQIDENPGAVAQWALEQGQGAVYDEAMSAWYEVDPKEASRFERALEMELIRQEMAQVTAPVQVNAEQQRHETAVKQLQTQYSDFGSVLESATPDELQGLDQQVVRQLQQQDPKAALEMVYRWVKSGRPVSQAAPEVVSAERAAEARAAKKDAAVVSGSSQPAREGKTTMDLLKESMLSPDPFSVSDGLKGF